MGKSSHIFSEIRNMFDTVHIWSLNIKLIMYDQVRLLFVFYCGVTDFYDGFYTCILVLQNDLDF